MKEIEEAANEYQSEYLESNEQHCSVADHFKSGVEWAESQIMSEWVSVDDRLPEVGGDRVLICEHKMNVRYPTIYIGRIDHLEKGGTGWVFDTEKGEVEYESSVNSQDMLSITHWQPLPPPPQTSK